MNKFQANICLITVTMLWATEPIFTANLPHSLPSIAAIAMVSGIAATILFICFYKRVIANFSKSMLKDAMHLMVLEAASLYGAHELMHGGGVVSCIFLLQINVVVSPFILMLHGVKIPFKKWIGTIIIFIGIIYTVSHYRISFHLIDVVIFFSIARALWIVRTHRIAPKYDVLSLSCVSELVLFLFTFAIWLCVEPKTFFAIDYTPDILCSIFACGYFLTGLSTIINYYAQRGTTATTASIIYSMDILFTLLSFSYFPSIIMRDVYIGPVAITGCTIVILGQIVSLMPWKLTYRFFKYASRKVHLENQGT